jgi:hypothetical protein
MNASRRRGSAARIRRIRTNVIQPEGVKDTEEVLHRESLQDVANFSSNIEEITDIETGSRSVNNTTLLDIDASVARADVKLHAHNGKKRILRRRSTMKFSGDKYVMNLHEAT